MKRTIIALGALLALVSCQSLKEEWQPVFTFDANEPPAVVPVSEADEKFAVSVAAPVISEGDLMGCVLFVSGREDPPAGEVEYRLAQMAASFLGKQMES